MSTVRSYETTDERGIGKVEIKSDDGTDGMCN